MPSKSDINPSTGKAYAINPASGVWDDNYWANTVEPQLKARYGVSSSPYSSVSPSVASIPDPIETAQRFRQFNIASNQPYISSLQARIPEIQQRFTTQRTQIEGEKEPLKQRYQNIIDELKRRETVELGQTSTTKSREFGRRGLPLSSGLFDVELQESQRPTREYFTGQTKEVGLGQEADLRQLANLQASLGGQETEALGGVQNIIGQLSTGEPTSALQNALQILNTQQQTQENAFTRAQQLRIAEMENQAKRYMSPEEQALKAAQTAYYLREAGQPYSPTKPTEIQLSTQAKNQLISQARSGVTLGNLVQQFGGSLGLNDIVKLYTAVSPYGPPKEGWAKGILGSGIDNPY